MPLRQHVKHWQRFNQTLFMICLAWSLALRFMARQGAWKVACLSSK
jgi:hypothetical protein